jgi:hypothetical protein
LTKPEGSRPIPAFEVNYGTQNQNFFKDLKLDQREFVETQESLELIDKISTSGDKNVASFASQNLFNVYQTRSYSAEITALGMPLIQPMMYFQLNNVPMFRGAYVIISTSHSIKPNHMTTTFKGVRVKKENTPINKQIIAIKDLNIDETNISGMKYDLIDTTGAIASRDQLTSPNIDRGKDSTNISPTGCNTAFPDLSFTTPVPQREQMPYEFAVNYLKQNTTERAARAIFAVITAEASKYTDGFNSSGQYNYAGVQTDVGRWGKCNPFIIGQYCKVDSGGATRAFAMFNSNNAFLDFMICKLGPGDRNFNGLNVDSWVNDYINRWWSPSKPTTQTVINEKKSIYNSAMNIYNRF